MSCSKKLWPDLQVDTFSIERHLRQSGHSCIAGLDEVGRGPLAGPVVAACVVLPLTCDYRQFVDSKSISSTRHAQLYQVLERIGALISIGMIFEAEIDEINILQASLRAMKKAVQTLSVQPDFLLVDGKFPVPVDIPQQTLIKGESKSASIAAASIVAKVVRDNLMCLYHEKYPVYHFHENKGYPTAKHRRALRQYGPCVIHRKTFKGVTR